MSHLLDDVPDLPRELHRLLDQIPSGRVTTYGDLARSLGDVGAARWVGEYLADHPHDEGCPCHRVVRKGGEIGLYVSGHPEEKIERLRAEGVSVLDGRAALSGTLVTEFTGPQPLARLRALQERMPRQVEIMPVEHTVRTVAGIDVSYLSPTEGIAAYVRMHPGSPEVIWSTTVRGEVTFPYITNYLTFRELVLFERLFEEVRRQRQEADVVLVDGNGILHPRRAGSATAFGLAAEIPTIGIGKKLLCGKVDLDGSAPGRPQFVELDGRPVGFAMRAGRSNRPFFASPGHRIDLDGTLEVVRHSLGPGRLPLPIHLADRISRAEVKRLKAGRIEES